MTNNVPLSDNKAAKESFTPKATIGVETPVVFDSNSAANALNPIPLPQIFVILVMLAFIIFLFAKIRKFWLAWLLATVLTPFVGIAFLMVFFGPASLYLLYGLSIIIHISAVISAIIGIMVGFWKHGRNQNY
ncbi:MAG: hypothetical protein H0T84_01400 [Tatlockia sp.]|nr:hypothetical protein [Tatlockia sp.]